jgi:hypothetical protein
LNNDFGSRLAQPIKACSEVGKRYLDWELPDHAGLGLEAVRPIRDEINRRVQRLLAELMATPD